MRRTSVHGWVLSITLVLTAGGLLNACVFGNQGIRIKEVKKCRLRFPIPADDENVLTWTVDIDSAEICEQMIGHPLRVAKEDEEPGDYQYLGSFRIETDEGTNEEMTLFHPIGHFKWKRKYYITEFALIKKELKRFQDHVVTPALKDD